jgi:hypothetical protein
MSFARASVCGHIAATVIIAVASCTADQDNGSLAERLESTCVSAPNVSGEVPLGRAGPFELNEGCMGTTCCRAGSEQVLGTPAQDALKGGPGSQCLVGEQGDDRADGSSGDDILVLGDGDDRGQGRSGRDVIFGNGGDDELEGGSHADTLFGGPGNDLLLGGSHDDLIIPGPDLDLVDAGSGDDTVVIRDLCEVTEGESYVGGPGQDTLIAPVTADDLATLGVSFSKFEEVKVNPSLSASSSCGACGCVLVGDEIQCCTGHGTCDDNTDPMGTVCTCDPGFTGDDCSVECPAGESCVAHVYRNGDGTTAGVAVGGTVLFEETSANASLDAFRALVSAQPTLFSVAPLTPAELDGLSFTQTWSFHGLEVHRYAQRYHDLPIHGPGSEISIVTAEEQGAISVTGTVIDSRVPYLGMENGILCEGPAAEALLAAWEARFPASSASLGPVELVAIPWLRTLAYRATVRVDGADAGMAVVSAASENGGSPIAVFDGRDTILDLSPIEVLADDWSLWPANATSDPQTTLFFQLRDGQGNVPLVGNTVDPDQCGGGAADCWMLTDTKLYLYDRNGQGPDPNLGGTYLIPLSSDDSFDASVGTLPYSDQTLYHKLRSAMLASSGLMQCRWDWSAQAGGDPCDEPKMLAVSNVSTGAFGGRYRGPDTIGPLLFTGGTLNQAWADRLFVPQKNSSGDDLAPARIEINGGNGTRTHYHELGHHLDWFSGHGIGGVVGDMMSLYAPAPGCSTPSTGCCRQNTSDEAMVAAETVGDLWNLFFGRKLHSEIAQGQPISLLAQAQVLSHSPGGNGAFTFATDRPGPGNTNPNTGCATGPGYQQRGLAQAFWEFADGLDCGPPPPLVPLACAMLTDPVNPDGEATPHVDVAGQALQYALTKQPPSGGTYQQLFDDMGEYIECIFGPTVFAEFQSIFAHHGITVFTPVPRMCPPICGDGVLNGTEECDGADLGGSACTDFGHPGGVLLCTAGCMFDTSACSVCGNGTAEDGEECDGADFDGADCDSATSGSSPFGPLQCTPGCNFDVSLCADCEPGTPGCRCLDTNNFGEDNPQLPEDGILGNGKYCQDDVSLGGFVRCVDPPGGDFCHDCTVGDGVWCPCVPAEGCSVPGTLDGPVTGNIGDTGQCIGPCDPSFLDLCDTAPAGNHGYCFSMGEAPEDGGVPDWFGDQYCANVDSQFSCVQPFGEAAQCDVGPGPECTF